jgi:hypothetical protein
MRQQQPWCHTYLFGNLTLNVDLVGTYARTLKEPAEVRPSVGRCSAV